MRRADFRKEGILNEANVQIIYENQKNMSVSNQIYSSSLGGVNPLKNLLASEGEKLVSYILYKI